MHFVNGKALHDVDLGDLKGMLGDKRFAEDQRVEYKGEVNLQKDGDKKEFLADVTQFANATGGFLVLGMSTERGIPTGVDGYEVSDADQHISGILDLLESSVRPRLQPPRSKAIEVQPGRYVVILEIEQSWNAPHMVTFKSSNKFHARTGPKKTLLDVDQVRAAFLAGATAVERMRAFRLDRVAKLLAGDTFLGMPDTEHHVMLVYHFLPLSAFARAISVDLPAVSERRYLAPLAPLGGREGPIYHFDGFTVRDSVGDWNSYGRAPLDQSSLTVFRNGGVEFADAACLTKRSSSKGPSISGRDFETALFQPHAKNAPSAQGIVAGILEASQAGLPLYVMLSVLSVEGCSIFAEGPMRHPGIVSSNRSVDRAQLLVPELELRTLDFTAEDLRPAFDRVWNAGGYPSSPYFDENGQWLLKLATPNWNIV